MRDFWLTLCGIGFGIFCTLKFVKIAEEKGYYKFATPMWSIALAGFVLSILRCILLIVWEEEIYLHENMIMTLIVLSLIIGIANFIIDIVVVVIEDKKKKYEKSKYPKSRTIDTLLCMILGIFGAHRFYEGKIKSGILWMVTFGCLGIGWLIDYIKAISGTVTDKDGNYIRRWE